MTRQSRITVIVGLPGSGKSHLISDMEDARAGLIVADDFHSCSRNDSPLPEASRYADDIVAALLDGRDVVLSDIAFCDEHRRLALAAWLDTLVPRPAASWIFFDNDLEQCLVNIQGRPGRDAERDAAEAKKFAQRYVPDDDPRPVYRSPDAEAQART